MQRAHSRKLPGAVDVCPDASPANLLDANLAPPVPIPTICSSGASRRPGQVGVSSRRESPSLRVVSFILSTSRARVWLGRAFMVSTRRLDSVDLPPINASMPQCMECAHRHHHSSVLGRPRRLKLSSLCPCFQRGNAGHPRTSSETRCGCGSPEIPPGRSELVGEGPSVQYCQPSRGTFVACFVQRPMPNGALSCCSCSLITTPRTPSPAPTTSPPAPLWSLDRRATGAAMRLGPSARRTLDRDIGMSKAVKRGASAGRSQASCTAQRSHSASAAAIPAPPLSGYPDARYRA
ncbi:hypothetical protein K466DRAFT_28621 [Polyporus arcularius HHB13444]|uniref:Uncharacterized protein n=1 Tax=Polyporus arcularius HHB13444 TaxID=1314778 RepID=A0A5C3NPK8_9APHY|nr:hypothetical protein K466DRAFT_28621 [Polyporus arcularius HHB13444]